MPSSPTSSHKRPHRRPRRRQADRRASSDNKLLTAANKLIAELGMDYATFQNVAERAGFSSGLVAQRFGSKIGLIQAQLQRAEELFRARIAKMEEPGGSGLDAILNYVPDYLENLQSDHEIRAYIILLADAVANYLPTMELFATAHEHFQSVIEELLKRGQAEGEVRQGIDPKLLAHLIGCTTIGITIQSIIDPDTDLKSISNLYVDALRQTLSTDKSKHNKNA